MRFTIVCRKVGRSTAADEQDLNRRTEILCQFVPVANRLHIIIMIQCMARPFELDQQVLSAEVLVEKQVGALVGLVTCVGLAEDISHLSPQRTVRAE